MGVGYSWERGFLYAPCHKLPNSVGARDNYNKVGKWSLKILELGASNG